MRLSLCRLIAMTLSQVTVDMTLPPCRLPVFSLFHVIDSDGFGALVAGLL